MADRPVTLQQAAEELGVHYMTVYRYVRTGRLPATRVGGTWQIDPADLGLVRLTRASKSDGGGAARRRSTTRLQGRLLAGDEAGAWTLLESMLASGTSPEHLLLVQVGPALTAIGERWAAGELSVADEHRASAVAMRLISRLGPRFARRGRKRGTLVLGAPAGELHMVPVAIAADLLRWQGFEVVELGADTPAGALVEAAGRLTDVIAIGLACTNPSSRTATRQTIAVLHEALPGIPVLLGGAAIADQDDARLLGADVYSGRNGDELVAAVDALTASV